jgi:phospholipase/carboxylesterase
MSVPGETELVQFEDWTLRVRPATISPARLLLLIHGFKGDENSMWVFTHGLRGEYWIVAPRAPHQVEDGGYSWRSYPTSDPPGLELFKPAVDRLVHMVDAYATAAGVDAGRFDVIGFSQGAAMTNLVALLHPDRVRKAGILAGFVPEGVESLAGDHPLDGMPFFVAHGTQDETVPIERARQSLAFLERAGAQVTFCEDQVGHKLSAGCLRALKSFLQD